MRNRRICKPIPAKRQIKVYKLLLKGPSGLAPLVNKFKKSCTAFYCEIGVGIAIGIADIEVGWIRGWEDTPPSPWNRGRNGRI